MDDGQKGVLVRTVLPLCDAAKHLLPDDVIMRFDGVQVANDGTVPFRRRARPPPRRFAVLPVSRTPQTALLTKGGSAAQLRVWTSECANEVFKHRAGEGFSSFATARTSLQRWCLGFAASLQHIGYVRGSPFALGDNQAAKVVT